MTDIVERFREHRAREIRMYGEASSYAIDLRDAIAEIERLRAPRVPIGWRLVPEEMAREMMDAGQQYLDDLTSSGREHRRHFVWFPATFRWIEFWQAMLAARPAPPATPEKPDA